MGGQEDNVLTLQGLAQRLEALECENALMRLENAELRENVAVLKGSETRRSADREPESSEFEGRVSRRALLSKAGAAAVAAVAAGTLLGTREAKAHHIVTDGNINADLVTAHYAFVRPDKPLDPRDPVPLAISGTTTNVADAAIVGINSGSRPGVRGQNDGAGPAILGQAYGQDGAGVLGGSTDGTGVWGQSGRTGYSGVYGQHVGSSGFGVVGDGLGSSNAGVLGRNSGGNGVQGEGRNGVHAKATSGYGGHFEGGKAQLRIVPKGTAGRPTTGAHTKGEIYMDSAANLFVCMTGGTPGTWRRVQTVTA